MPRSTTSRPIGPLRGVLARALATPPRRRYLLDGDDPGDGRERARATAWTIAASVHALLICALGWFAMRGTAPRPEVAFRIVLREPAPADAALVSAIPQTPAAPTPTRPANDRAAALHIGATQPIPFDEAIRGSGATSPAEAPPPEDATHATGGAHVRVDELPPADVLVLRRRTGAGTAADEALARALDWLERHQRSDGLWGGEHPSVHCSQPADCLGHEVTEGHVGLSALAVLALLHGANFPGRAEPERALRIGVRVLTDRQAPDGCLAPRWGGFLYDHGFATLALLEASARDEFRAARSSAEQAVCLIVRAQQEDGGWDYQDRASGRSDACVSAVQVMALRAALDSGMRISTAVLDAARRYFEGLCRPDGTAEYARVGPDAGRCTAGSTASAYLARRMLGTAPDDPWMAAARARMKTWRPAWEAIADGEAAREITLYYWFVAAQGMIHGGPADWQPWNQYLQGELLAHQRTRGCMSGSWAGPDAWLAGRFGPPLATALGALTLETWHRQDVAAAFETPLPSIQERMQDEHDADRLRALLRRAVDDRDRSMLAAEIPPELDSALVLEFGEAVRVLAGAGYRDLPIARSFRLRAAWEACLKDPQPALRRRAAELTPGLASLAWYPALADFAANETDVDTQILLLQALDKTPERSLLNRVLPVLRAPEPRVVCTALRLFGQLGTRAHLGDVLALTDSASTDVRREAIGAVLRLPTSEDDGLRPHVVEWLQHPDSGVRQQAQAWLEARRRLASEPAEPRRQ